MIVTVSNEQNALAVEVDRLAEAARGVMDDAGRDGALSIAVVDDETIHRLNVEFLEHDYPTDVLSFALEDDGRRLEGEVIVSAETAIANAAEYGWPAEHELLLYVLHGALHLVGYGDKTTEEAAEMRRAEAEHLRRWGVELPKPVELNGAQGVNPS